MSNVEKKHTALIVDDEKFNVRILERLLQEAGYHTISCYDGKEAWDYLQQKPKEPDVILLDRMMPNMNGIEVLEKLHQHDILKHTPVIMQTAASAPQQVKEGIAAGVYYYLSKPFEEEVLLSIVKAAIEDHLHHKALRETMEKNKLVIGLITLCQFKLRTLREAYNLSYFIANLCPQPDKVVAGLYGLIVNAHEHGNLGIGFEQKMALKKQGTWQQEILARERLPANLSKCVEVRYGHDNEIIKIYIKDDGAGFNWKQYLDNNIPTLTACSGRGIEVAKHSFDKLEYLGKGNEVLCTIHTSLSK